MTASQPTQLDGERGPVSRPRLSSRQLARVRRSRRHPKLTQFDGLHLKYLIRDLRDAIDAAPGPVRDVLDVFCGARPYDDLMPEGARVVGFDIDDHYGVADVVGGDFLPFDDASFDLVTCIEGFHYVVDQARGVEEIARVLRPGGTAILTIPLVWEYDRGVPEVRHTGNTLEALFADWEDVVLVEDGGRGVAWATLTGHLIEIVLRRAPSPVRPLLRLPCMLAFAAINLLGDVIERTERRWASGSTTLPMNLLISARKPAGAHAPD